MLWCANYLCSICANLNYSVKCRNCWNIKSYLLLSLFICPRLPFQYLVFLFCFFFSHYSVCCHLLPSIHVFLIVISEQCSSLLNFSLHSHPLQKQFSWLFNNLSKDLRVLEASPQLNYGYFIYTRFSFILQILIIFQVFEGAGKSAYYIGRVEFYCHLEIVLSLYVYFHK